MPFSLNSTEILNQFQQKYSELCTLLKILKSKNILTLLSEQQAPSVQLQKKDEVYFAELMVILAHCQLLRQILADSIIVAKSSNIIDKKVLQDIINLSGDIKDAKLLALQKLVAFENNPVYQRLRESIGVNDVTHVLNIINNADSLLSDLSCVEWANAFVTEKILKIESEIQNRKYKQLKNELINYEKEFTEQIKIIVSLNESFNIYQILIKLNYRYLADFFALSSKLLFNSEQLHAILEKANIDPTILTLEKTFIFFTNYYATLQAASNLKCKIERYEIESFHSNSENCIVFLREGFRSVDSRGLYSFISMPFQRICRYPLLLKEIVSSLSKQKEIATDADHSINNDIYCYTAFLDLSLSLAKKSDEMHEQLEKNLNNRTSWTPSASCSTNRGGLLFCRHRSMPSKIDLNQSLLPNDPDSSSKAEMPVCKQTGMKEKSQQSLYGSSRHLNTNALYSINSSEILTARSRLKKTK